MSNTDKAPTICVHSSRVGMGNRHRQMSTYIFHHVSDVVIESKIGGRGEVVQMEKTYVCHSKRGLEKAPRRWEWSKGLNEVAE